jgi:FdhD protein
MDVDKIQLPAQQLTQQQLYVLRSTPIRLKETTYKSAGSVHALLFSAADALVGTGNAAVCGGRGLQCD